MLLLATACAPTRNLDVAPEGNQSIHLWHKASGERVNIVYRTAGHYDKNAMGQIDYILRDRHTDEVYPMDPKLIDIIADLRDRMVMAPDTEIEVLSGYRSPETNEKIAKTNKYVAKQSYHMKGQAADIRIPDMISSVLEHVAKSLQRGGVALYPDSGHVHVDTGPVRGWEVNRGREAGMRNAPSKAAHTHARTSVPRDTTYRVPLKARESLKAIEDSYSDLPSVPAAAGAVKNNASQKVGPKTTPQKPRLAPLQKPAVKSGIPRSKDLRKELEKKKATTPKTYPKKPVIKDGKR